MIGWGKKQGGLYTLQVVDLVLPQPVSDMLSKFSSLGFVNSDTSYSSNLVIDDTSLWHSRLGHPSFQRLVLLQSVAPIINTCNNNKSFDCTICPLVKQKRLPFPSFAHCSISCFDLVHVDIWGPYSTPSLNGSKYFLSIVDDFSKCTWVFLMPHKSDAFSLIQSFYNMVVNQFHTTIKVIRFNNGLEFLCIPFMPPKVLFVSYLVLKLHNRTLLLRENINTS